MASRRPNIISALQAQVADPFDTLTAEEQTATYAGIAPPSIPGSWDQLRQALGVNAPHYLTSVQRRAISLRRNLGAH